MVHRFMFIPTCMNENIGEKHNISARVFNSLLRLENGHASKIDFSGNWSHFGTFIRSNDGENCSQLSITWLLLFRKILKKGVES